MTCPGQGISRDLSPHGFITFERIKMKVWVLTHHSYGEVFVYNEDADPLTFGSVGSELEALASVYPEEVERFTADIARIREQGRGYTEIEERFDIELQQVLEG